MPRPTGETEDAEAQASDLRDGVHRVLLAAQVADSTAARGGIRESRSKVVKLDEKIYAKVEPWRHKPTEGAHAVHTASPCPGLHRRKADLGQ